MALVQVVTVMFLLGMDTSKGDYGPVNLDSIDPLSMSWNQIHWLVKDQIKEVEELKAEHDEIYNEITGCYGLEKCLAEFDLLNISPGSKLWGLGLRKMDLSMSALTRQREEVEQTHIRLDAEMRVQPASQENQEEEQPCGQGCSRGSPPSEAPAPRGQVPHLQVQPQAEGRPWIHS